MLGKGKPLGGSWDGGWGAQPGPLSIVLPESSSVYVCSLLYGPPTHARTSPFAFHMLSSGHPLPDTPQPKP